MKECGGHLGQTEFDHIIKEVYGDISSSCSETDLESSLSCFMDIVMEMAESFINKEVLSYDHNTIDGNDISKH